MFKFLINKNVETAPLLASSAGGSVGSSHSGLIAENVNMNLSGPLERSKTATEPEKRNEDIAPVIGILGAKGGVGATTIAINLAAKLAKQRGRTLLVDADMQQPHIALMLGKEAQHTLVDLLDRSHEIDEEVLAACSIPISANLPQCSLLTPPLSGDAGLSVNLTQMAQCLSSIKRFGSAWIIDLPSYLDRHLVTVMDSCDIVVLVLEPTFASAISAARWLKIFNDLGYGENKILKVINRSGGKLKAVEQELQKHIDLKNTLKIPNAYELSERSWTHGEPAVLLDPKAPYSVAINALAKEIGERV